MWYHIDRPIGAETLNPLTQPIGDIKKWTFAPFLQTSAGRGWIHKCVSSPIRFSEKGIP